MKTAREQYREDRRPVFQKMKTKAERVNDRKKWRQDLRVCIAAIEKGVRKQPWREPTAVAGAVCPREATDDNSPAYHLGEAAFKYAEGFDQRHKNREGDSDIEQCLDQFEEDFDAWMNLRSDSPVE